MRWFLPATPDVVGLLRRQLAVTVEGIDAFAAWAAGEDRAGATVRECEHRADEAKRELYRALREAFVTPLDPEDLFALSRGLDHVLDQAKDAVREAEVMACEPDAALAAMAAQVAAAVRELDGAVAPREPRAGRHRARRCRDPGGAAQSTRIPGGDGGAAARRGPARGDGAPRAVPSRGADRRDGDRRRRARALRGRQRGLTVGIHGRARRSPADGTSARAP
jgi:hypothetical protein